MEGYRALESGDLRILEAGDTRVTEGFIEGFANLSATGTISVVGKLKAVGISPLSSTGSVLLVGQGRLFGRLNVSATGSVVAVNKLKARGLLNVQGVGSISPLGLKRLNASTALSGLGTFTSIAGFKFTGVFAQPDEEVIRILESGDIRVTENGTARSVVNYNPNFGYGYIRTVPYFKARGLFGTLIEDITRTLESGDVRITEEGDIRVSVNYNPNFGYGYINTVPFVTVFSSDPYVKYESNWLRAVPYVKYEQEWIVPSNVYRHTNGNWKRIY